MTLSWEPDELGPSFQRADIPLGEDPDGEGAIVATLVRHTSTDTATGPALLWVHGMTDYFFQAHVADHYAARGFAFYGLDLRKCGRARREGQLWHYTSDLAYYFKELTLAAEELVAAHGRVVPIAHSTGGLIVPLWVDHLRRTRPDLHRAIAGIVLNSAWLDMMYPTALVAVLRPVVRVVGKLRPLMPLPGGNLRTYGESIYKGERGEWDFDLTKKPTGGHKKFVGWLRTILLNQARVHRGSINVGVPVLSLCSAHSYLGKPYTPAADVADAVLDVEQIQRWSPRLGRDVRVAIIDGARHDVFLSLPDARARAFSLVDDWLPTL